MTRRWTAPLPDRAHLSTAAAAGAGTGVFLLAGWPLPFLFGPMAGCLLAGLGGVRLRGAGRLGDAMRTILGVAVGASVTPDLVHDLPRMALSLSLVPVFLLLAGALGYPLLRRGFGFDHPTAWYSAMPGGLQDMLLFGEEAGGNPRILSLVHATRILLIVTLAPPLLWFLWGVDLHRPPAQAAAQTPVAQMLWMLVAALGGWWLALRVRLFGASILGPMIATAALSLAGVITVRPPAEAIWVAQVFIGVAIGARYSGLVLADLRHAVAAGLTLSLMLAILTLVFAEGLYQAGLAPHLEAFMAFAPGGQAEMAILAILAGADVALVVAHHVLRILIVITLSPVVERVARRWLAPRG